MIKQYHELLLVHDYYPLVVKNQYMKSYSNDKQRVNIYFTTGTIQIQTTEGGYKQQTIIRNPTEEELETYL